MPLASRHTRRQSWICLARNETKQEEAQRWSTSALPVLRRFSPRRAVCTCAPSLARSRWINRAPSPQQNITAATRGCGEERSTASTRRTHLQQHTTQQFGIHALSLDCTHMFGSHLHMWGWRECYVQGYCCTAHRREQILKHGVSALLGRGSAHPPDMDAAGEEVRCGIRLPVV